MKKSETDGKAGKNVSMDYIIALENQGHLQRQQGKPECVKTYEKAFQYALQQANSNEAGVLAYNLGHAYNEIQEILDYVQSADWYYKALELLPPSEDMLRMSCIAQLGAVAWYSYEDWLNSNTKYEELDQQTLTEMLMNWIQTALERFQQALELCPNDANDQLSRIHLFLGNIHVELRKLPEAKTHYGQALKRFKLADDLAGAAEACYSAALAFTRKSYFPDALDYAETARNHYEKMGSREKIAKADELIKVIKK